MLPQHLHQASLTHDLSLVRSYMRDSSGTILPVIGVLGLSLSEFCDLIWNYQSEIISREGYVQVIGRVQHRFLVLELQRDGKKPIWVAFRLDRRRSTKVSVLGVLCAATSTPANDTVSSMHRLCFASIPC